MTTSHAADPLVPSAEPQAGRGRTWALLIVLALAGFVATYVLAVLTEAGQRVDNAVMDGATVSGREYLQLSRGVPDPYLLLGICAVLALLGALRHRRTGLAVAVAVGLLMVSIQVLKAVLPRPQLADPWVMANSLPSGHTGAAAAVAIALLLCSPRSLLRFSATIGVTLTAYMGVVVVLLGYHRPSDVIASVLLAVAALALGLLVRGPAPPDPAPPR